MKTLWVEKYRPKTLDNYISDESLRSKVEEWIKKGEITHLLFSGIQGIGKTTIAKIIVNSIPCDYLYVNASDEGGINFIRNKIIPFAQSKSIERKLKVIILDEADGVTPEFMAALRNVIETYSERVRFILTANYPERIIAPIRSRCQEFRLHQLPLKEVKKVLERILKSEGVKYQWPIVERIITRYYPDIRKIIQVLEQSTVDNVLEYNEEKIEEEYLERVRKILEGKDNKQKKWKEVRLVLSEQYINYDTVFRYLYKVYDNPEATVLIAEHYYRAAFTPDKEITIMSLIKQLLEL